MTSRPIVLRICNTFLVDSCDNRIMSEPAINIRKLSPEERLRLLEELWESLSDDDLPLTAAQRAELDRRLDAIDREGPAGIPWREVLRRLQSDSS